MTDIQIISNYRKYEYVILSALASFLSFCRSFMFIRYLPYLELGQIAVAQTIMMLVTFAQFGFVNGAYIEYAKNDKAANRAILDSGYSLFLILSCVSIVVVVLLMFMGFSVSSVWPTTLAVGTAAGLGTLLATFLNNVLIAEDRLRQTNLVNVLAGSVSILMLLMWPSNKFVGSIVSLLSQPIAVCLLVWSLNPDLRPTMLAIDRSRTRVIINVGLSPYISAVAALAIAQIERWSVLKELGTEALGRFYPVIPIGSVYALVPTTLLNYYFPKTKRSATIKDYIEMLRLCGLHKRDLIMYMIISSSVVCAAVGITFHMNNVREKYDVAIIIYAIPSLIIYTMRDSSALILFSIGRMSEILIASCVSLVLFGCFVLFLMYAGRFTLEWLLVVKFLALLPGTVWLGWRQHLSRKSVGALP